LCLHREHENQAKNSITTWQSFGCYCKGRAEAHVQIFFR
jgi:hypothetical protein